MTTDLVYFKLDGICKRRSKNIPVRGGKHRFWAETFPKWSAGSRWRRPDRRRSERRGAGCSRPNAIRPAVLFCNQAARRYQRAFICISH